jgi:hypothetical protein
MRTNGFLYLLHGPFRSSPIISLTNVFSGKVMPQLTGGAHHALIDHPGKCTDDFQHGDCVFCRQMVLSGKRTRGSLTICIRSVRKHDVNVVRLKTNKGFLQAFDNAWYMRIHVGMSILRIRYVDILLARKTTFSGKSVSKHTKPCKRTIVGSRASTPEDLSRKNDITTPDIELL